MKRPLEANNEMHLFAARFGLAPSPEFEGAEAECPICGGMIDQVALTLDLVGFTELECNNCGAVLAA